MASVASRSVRILMKSSRDAPSFHMDVGALLFADRALPDIFIAARRLVIVAEEHACFIREIEQHLNRVVERSSIAAWKVAARCAEVRHEDRITDKHGIADKVGHAGRRMARRRKCACLDITDTVGLTRLEEVVKLAAIGMETLSLIENFAEDRVGQRVSCLQSQFYRRAVRGYRAQLSNGLHDMGVDDPLTGQSVLANETD